MDQRHGNRLGRGQRNKEDVVDTQTANLGWLPPLNVQYEAAHCPAAKECHYSEIRAFGSDGRLETVLYEF